MLCKYSERCPIYNGILRSRKMTIQAYMDSFCNAGEENWSKCKRFQIAEIYGSCPPEILPNDRRNIDDIIKEFF